MNVLIDAAVGHARTVLLALLLVLVGGVVAYLNIPKESDPDVAIPIIYVNMTHEGISPEDAERLLVRPMEKELRGIDGVKELRARADEGSAAVILEFEAGFDSDAALEDVREKVDIAKSELPAESDEPSVNEVNVALFPVLVVTLSGDVPERTLLALARDLRDEIESLAGVLEVEIAGEREEVLEFIVDPALIESYGLSLQEVLGFIQNNNRLVAAGALDTGEGRFAVKVPGLIENATDVLNLPMKVEGDTVVTIGDVATVRRTFKDPEGFARVDGEPALALEVTKRIGVNIIETIEQVRGVVEGERADWPAGVEVSYSQDKSDDIRSMLTDLQNNVISAILLVMVVIVAALGTRSAGLVGVAIPGSFLMGILVLAALGLTINIVVLFSLILAVGMLVDGAIVVTEFADRKMAEGLPRREAYARAAKRMAWPITASTATTLAAFMPLLFWPGIVGQFMKFLPITLLATLAASLLMALVFVPTLGSLIGKSEAAGSRTLKLLSAAETGHLDDVTGPTGSYIRVLRRLLRHPGKVLLAAAALLVAAYAAYGAFGRGVEFFPDVEPENAVLQVHARGDLSVREKDALVREVEDRILELDRERDEFATVYARSGSSFRSEDVDEDVVGLIQLEFADWRERRPAREILDDVRERTRDLAGIHVEARKEEAGPSQGKPIQLELSADRPELLGPAVRTVREGLEGIDGLVEVSDSRPVPGIEWRVEVDREKAARFGADVSLVGSMVQMVTNGVLVDTFRPDDADDEIDIRLRFPYDERTLDQLDQLRVPTVRGPVPASSFVERVPAQKTGILNRTSARRVMTVSADVAEGVLVDEKVQEIRSWLAGAADLDPRVDVRFTGEDEDQQEAQSFLVKAFGVALFIMAIILVTQFNSFYQALLILSAVVFSTVGVLLGLLVTQQPFGIVMSGVGVIALAGIVVNNNIVLIDTYNVHRAGGMDPLEAVLRTGAQRLRPVMLTTVTTILGLLPMVFGVNIDFLTREITAGAPSTQWWTQLATAVAGGLTFATMLTLVLTPSLLMLGANVSAYLARRRGVPEESTPAAGDAQPDGLTAVAVDAAEPVSAVPPRPREAA